MTAQEYVGAETLETVTSRRERLARQVTGLLEGKPLTCADVAYAVGEEWTALDVNVTLEALRISGRVEVDGARYRLVSR